MFVARRIALVACLLLVLPAALFAQSRALVTLSADMAVGASDSPDPVAPDGNITYTVTVTNAGPSAATNAHLNAVLNGTLLVQSLTAPAGWSCPSLPVGHGGSFTCTAATFAAGGNSQFTVVLKAGKAQFGINDGTIVQNFNVNAAEPDPNSGNNSVNVSTAYVAPKANMGVTATDSPDPVAPDGNITYTVNVTNAGPDPATNAKMSVVLNNTLLVQSLSIPAGWTCPSIPVGHAASFTCSAATFPSGGNVSFTVVLKAGQAQFGINDGTIMEAFTTGADEFDSNNANNSITVSTAYVAPKANLGIAATDSPDPVAPDGNITYGITITNGGPAPASNARFNVVLNNTLLFQSLSAPAGWSCATPAVNGGTSFTCNIASLATPSTSSFTLVLKAAKSQFGNINQTIVQNFNVNSDTFDTDNSNNSINVSTTYATPLANLAVTASDAPDPVAVGNNITYTITLTNNGPDAGANTHMSALLQSSLRFQSVSAPAGFSCTAPAVGATGTVDCVSASFAVTSAGFTLAAQVDPALIVGPGGTTIQQTFTTSSDAQDTVQANNGVIVSTAILAPPSADLSVTKTAGSPAATRGGTMTYTITVRNNGPDAATAVVMTDALPSSLLFSSIAAPAGFNCSTPAIGSSGTITCTAATLANGATAAFTLNTTVAANAAGSIANTAGVSSATADPNGGNSSGGSGGIPVNGESIPALSEWALIALAAAVAAVALGRLSR